jgi:hypothetical protein
METGSLKGRSHLSHITDYYKNLFGPSDSGMFSLDEDNRDDITQISLEDNEKIVAVFTEQEVKEAAFKMKHNKAPGPDGFIKGDLMALFKTSTKINCSFSALILES